MEAEWPLILFTFFLCLCGGVLGSQGLLTLVGKGKKMQKVSLIVALVALVVGGISVLTHLQHWERIFNAFTALLAGNGYGISGITLELWGCVIIFCVGALYFLFMYRSEEGVAPKWSCVLAIVAGIALPVVTGESYVMEAVPSWNTPLLLLYYLTNTVFMGALASLIIAIRLKDDEAKEFLTKVILIGGIAELVVVVIYAIYIFSTGGVYSPDVQYYFDPTLPDVPMVDRVAIAGGILAGAYSPLFYLGVIVIGVGVPLALIWMAKKLEDLKKLTVYAGVALGTCVIGGIAWRVILYWVAMSIFAFY